MQPEPQDFASTPSLAPDDVAQPNVLKQVFVGRNGLRAFWRLLIFVAIVGVLVFGVNVAAARILHGRSVPLFTARAVVIREAISFFIVVIATLIMARFERHPFSTYGLPGRGAFGGLFFEGLFWGFAAECATMTILALTGNASFHGFDQHGMTALKYGVLWGLAFLAVGFFEEFLFRGYPQFTLATGIGFWPAAFIISGMFWLAHMGNPGETWIGGLATALAALIFCVSLWLTGNLWFAIGMHAAWDWTETYFFGVPDSGMPANGHLFNSTLSGSKWMTGGSVGPEGSVVELAIIVVVIALLFLRFRNRPTPAYRAEIANPQFRHTKIVAISSATEPPRE